MFKTLKKQKKLILKGKSLVVNEEAIEFKGQVILEFTFCMIVILLMIFGVAKVFLWTGQDLVERRIAHDNILIGANSSIEEIDPYFYTPIKMNAIWEGG